LSKKLYLFTTILFFSFFLTYILHPPTWASPQSLPVHNTDTGLHYESIQAAISAKETLNGHTIHVDAGTYYENIIVNKSISLIGQNKSNTTIHGRFPRNIIHIVANNVTITGFTVEESEYGYNGIYLYQSESSNITDNIIKSSYYGIHLHTCASNLLHANLISDCEYGIRLYNSTNNILLGNTILSNKNGIHLDISSDNIVIGNNASSNTWNGIYLYSSSNNDVSGNNLSSNEARGIRLHNSENNTISANTVSKNENGIHLYNSSNNTLYDNPVSNNTDGIWLAHSSQNLICGNAISFNTRYGLRLLDSSRNNIFQNNFINNTEKNVEQPSNTSLANLWDNHFEGNYWSTYKGNDTNKDGIGDTPYIVDERTWLGVHSQDNHPLIAPFQRLSLDFQNKTYFIEFISSSTIKELQYHHDPQNENNTIIFKSTELEGRCFCRICIPHSLVNPPYIVKTNGKHPIYNSTIYTNGTYTWIYIEHNGTKQATTIAVMHKATLVIQPPIWSQWPFWGIMGLTIFAAILVSINIKYRRIVNKQKSLIRTYEEKLQKAPFAIASELFRSDVARRGLKIAKFEEKYGVKVRPRNSFGDIIRSIRSKKRKSEK